MTVSRRSTPADYARLGLPLTATAAEIKSAYRVQAMKHHPDRNPGDPEAARRFQLIRESYEAIAHGGPPLKAVPPTPRGRPAPGQPPRPGGPGRPLPPRPAAVRRPPPAPVPRPIASMDSGDVLWAESAAILVAPDRTCFLDPAGIGEPHSTPRANIRVEHRHDGFHVELPSAGRYRWSISPRAASGMQLASLGIGDTQQRASGRNPLMPSYLLSGTVATMVAGQRGWTVATALIVEPSGQCWIDGSESLNDEPTMLTTVRIERHTEGLYAIADGLPEAWARRQLPRTPSHLPLLGVVLGGVALHPPSRHHR